MWLRRLFAIHQRLRKSCEKMEELMFFFLTFKKCSLCELAGGFVCCISHNI